MSDRTYADGAYGTGYYGLEVIVVTPPTPEPALPPIVFAATVDPGPMHFDYPLRLGRAGMFATNPQGSHGDVVAATIGVLSYRRAQVGPDGEQLPGHRMDRPELGIDDPTFRQGGADLDAIRDVLADQEPRAEELIERDPSLLPTLLDIVTVTPRA